MGFLRRLGNTVVHNPIAKAAQVVIRNNPIATAVHIVQHPVEAIKNPISTITHSNPITAIIHEEAKKIAPAPIITPSSILHPGRIVTPDPIHTLCPIFIFSLLINLFLT